MPTDTGEYIFGNIVRYIRRCYMLMMMMMIIMLMTIIIMMMMMMIMIMMLPSFLQAFDECPIHQHGENDDDDDDDDVDTCDGDIIRRLSKDDVAENDDFMMMKI